MDTSDDLDELYALSPASDTKALFTRLYADPAIASFLRHAAEEAVEEARLSTICHAV